MTTLMIPAHRSCTSRNYLPDGVRVHHTLSTRLIARFVNKAKEAAAAKGLTFGKLPAVLTGDMELATFATGNTYRLVMSQMYEDFDLVPGGQMRTLADLSAAYRPRMLDAA